MKFIALFMLAVSFCALAKDESKHMVTFGNNFGSKWSLASTKSDVDSGLGLDDYDITKGNLGLNYAFRIVSQFQIGAALGSSNNETLKKRTNGTEEKADNKTTSFYLFGIFNFSEDFTESFYVLGGLGRESIETTYEDTQTATATKEESDVSNYIFQLGKRFNLKAAGIQNLVYSPSISYKFGSVGGDLNDQGVDSFSTLELDIVKFDLLF